MEAESVIKGRLKDYVIIRTSHIYGKSNGRWDTRLTKLFSKIKKNQPVYRFRDMYRSPILVDDLAKICWRLAGSDFRGIIHVAGERKSIYEFSQEVLNKNGFNASLVKPSSYKQSGLVVSPDTSLNTALARGVIGFELK